VTYGLSNLNVDAFVAGLVAFAISFAIPYHGIFAISYNTVSQLLWVVYLIRFLNWPSERNYIWSLICGVMVFAHPPSAIVMFSLVVTRYCLERQFRQSLYFVIELFCLAILTAIVSLQFANSDQYLSSLIFSSSFGVGKTFLSGYDGPILLLKAIILFIFSKYILARVGQYLLLVLLLSFSVYYLVECFGGGSEAYIYLNVKLLAVFSAIAYALSQAKAIPSRSHSVSCANWLVVLTIFYSATLCITSSNGIGQATGAFMVVTPLMIGLNLCFIDRKPSTLVRLSISLSLIVLSCAFIVHWISNPYRDQSWLKSDEEITTVNELKGIYVSAQRFDFITRVVRNFRSEVQGRKMLVAGGLPVFYFLTGAVPETCMYFFHSLPTENADIEFRKCMVAKNPEMVLSLFGRSITENTKSLGEKYINELTINRSFNCSEELVDLERNGTNGGLSSHWKFCR
jgi:hypothetical protein